MTVRALIFTPHQDDETLSFLATIRALLEAGHEVWVILLTTGQNSGVRASTGLSITDFIKARDDEMLRALRRLGVRFENIHIDSHRTPDGQLGVEDAESMMTYWINLASVGGHQVWVKTYSPHDGVEATRHTDHKACGMAALNLLSDGTIMSNGLRFGVEPWLLAAGQTKFAGRTLMIDRASNTGVLRNALDEYKAIEVIGGKYGIGWKSVDEAFALVRANPVSYYHAP